MRFGIFGGGHADFHDSIEFNVEAEALGFHSTFLVEHHFTGWNQLSAPLTLLTWLAARTRTLRLGTAVMVLPWHHPVLLAEQAAMLDVLSGGRLDFGVGKGYRHNEFTGFGIPTEEADVRFEEALDLITKAWTFRERFSYHGTFWHCDDIIVEPPTFQKPHPPFWTGAGSAPSISGVAERGHNLLLDQFASIELTGERISMFKAEVEARDRAFDPMEVIVARDMYVADNDEEKEAAIARSAAAYERILSVARSPVREGGSHVLAYSHSAAQTAASPLIGTADEIAAKLEALRKVGVEYVILNCSGSRESLRRFAGEVMPAFSD